MRLRRDIQSSTRTAAIIGVIAALASPAVAADRMYLAESLGIVGHGQSAALGISSAGHVTGWFETEQPIPLTHAFVWKDGVLTDLGDLGSGWAIGNDVNAAGQVVGVSRDGAGEQRAFYAYDGYIYDLNKIIPDTRRVPPFSAVGYAPHCWAPLRLLVEATAINDEGWILACGYFDTDDELHGVLLEPSGLSPETPGYIYYDLGYLPQAAGPTDCVPLGINDLVEVVGASGGDAFFWSEQVISPLEHYASLSQANAINNAGTIVGWTEGDTGRHACNWDRGFRFDLGVARNWVSEAADINDTGIIVGWAAPAIDDPHQAMLWEGCIPVNLNDVTVIPVRAVLLPWDFLAEATAIDAEGRIVGFGVSKADDKVHAFLLTPFERSDRAE